MAKAQPAPEVTRKTDPQEWFADMLRTRFAEVTDRIADVLDAKKAADDVHDMRVAIRRLRSLIRDMNVILDADAFKRTSKTLKKVADLLGRVRDQDVFIKALERVMSETGKAISAEAVDKLIADGREVRKDALTKVKKALSGSFDKVLTQRFDAAVEIVLVQPHLFQPPSVESAGHDIISARLDDLVELGDGIYDPIDSTDLHDLRIAAKHLRYAIEVFGPVFGDEVTDFAGEVTKLQSFLGELHDIDLWTKDLSTHLKKRKLRSESRRTERETLSVVLAAFVQRRSTQYLAALDLWNEWQQTDRFKDIRGSIGDKN